MINNHRLLIAHKLFTIFWVFHFPVSCTPCNCACRLCPMSIASCSLSSAASASSCAVSSHYSAIGEQEVVFFVDMSLQWPGH